MRFAIALIFVCSIVARAEIVGKSIEYTANGDTLKGYIAYDDAVKGKRPGILVVHEWWGFNDYARRRADMLAKLGYVGFALDMYGEGRTAEHPDNAAKFSSEVMKNFPVMKQRFMAAMEQLKMNDRVDPSRIGAIGYCFGGGVVLNMARAGVDLDGVVTFHGSLASVTEPKKGDVKAKILVCNGAADKFTTEEDINKFKEQMKAAGADFTFINYPGAIHSFTNPASTALGKKFNLPLAYNKSADEKSWEDMKQFFHKVFAGKD